MLGRVIFHIIVLALLVAIGAWLIYKDLLTTSEVNVSAFSGMLAAMYWFGFLIYALLVSLLFLMFKWRTWKSFLVTHLLCAAIGMFSTAGMVALGQLRAERQLSALTAHSKGNPVTPSPQSTESASPHDGASPSTTVPNSETDLAVTPRIPSEGLASEPEHTD